MQDIECLKHGCPMVSYICCPHCFSCLCDLQLMDGLDFFASKVVLGKDGVESIPELGDISPFEEEGLKEAIPQLQASITKGVAFANGN